MVVFDFIPKLYMFSIIVDSTNLSNELFPMNYSLSSRPDKKKDNSMMAFVKEMVVSKKKLNFPFFDFFFFQNKL